MACSSKKEYSDFKEEDFYKVQGIITSVFLTSNPFDNTHTKNIEYIYFLDDSIPRKGRENNLNMFEAVQGYPLELFWFIKTIKVSASMVMLGFFQI